MGLLLLLEEIIIERSHHLRQMRKGGIHSVTPIERLEFSAWIATAKVG